MAENKRVPVKWIRDKAKKAYEKTDSCYICNTNMKLELHHLNSIASLLEKWCLRKGYPIDTDEQVIAIRDEFIELHREELFDLVVTLCNKHHVNLHTLFGKVILPGSAGRQKMWLDKQRDKHNGIDTESTQSVFSEFL